MANAVWSILCRTAVVDKFTNSLSIFNVVEGIQIVGRPPIPSKRSGPYVNISLDMTHVSLWVRDETDIPETPASRIKFALPNGGVSYSPEYKVDLQTSGKARLIARVPTLRYAGPGDYLFVLQEKKEDDNKVRWRTLSRVTLALTIAAPDKGLNPQERA